MASDKEFFERYKDPRWQKRRLEVMQDAGFACERCNASDKTLHVHHGYYGKGSEGKGMMPWDYPAQALHCLCEDCHKEVQGKLDYLKLAVGHLHCEVLDEVIGYVLGFILRNGYIRNIAGFDFVPVTGYAQLRGLTRALGLPVGALDNAYFWSNWITKRTSNPQSEGAVIYRRDVEKARADLWAEVETAGTLTVF